MLRPKLPPNLWEDLAAIGLQPCVLFAACLALCNLSFGFLAEVLDHSDAELLILPLAGCLVAEAAILPAWLVWASRPLWQRLLGHVGVALALFVLWYLGMLVWHLRSYDDRVKVPAMFLFSLPAVSVGVSAPLWLMRLFFGWRIVVSENSGTADEKLSIRDFLVGMSVVGVALASARLAMAIGPPQQESDYWLPLGIAVGIAAAAGLFLELPIVWFTFRFQSPLLCVIAVGVTMLIPWLIIVTVGTVMEGQIPDGRAVAGLCLLFLSAGYTAALAFRLTRASGYRLQIGTR